MADEALCSFEDLANYRRQLQKFCFAHEPSVDYFRYRISFRLNTIEGRLGRLARHLSSSATCIESLLDCPAPFRPAQGLDIVRLAREFSVSALAREEKKWRSEGAAQIYCRCRTLPLLIQSLPSYDVAIRSHLEGILWQLTQDTRRLAIGEASREDPNWGNWYPPNAYHTYWTLYIIRALGERFPAEYAALKTDFVGKRFDFDRLSAEMLTWARQMAGQQSGFHSTGSSSLDSDQLAWSLAILIEFGSDFQANLAQQEFIKYAFACLFAQQTAAGIWRTGAPLFHYPKSGNAYCYVFETFNTLLKSTLKSRADAPFLRELLRPYARKLLDLWNYAVVTEIPLSTDGKAIGWSSGHRANHKEPESWATASVFSYAQTLRRLVGLWTREAAGADLHVSTTQRSVAEAIRNLRDRGDTWSLRDKSAATQLLTSFVNPVIFLGSGNNLEPDSLVIGDTQARGAILFGPPGTSKTTLCRAVADAIDWDYAELHASHFVAEGLTQVQRTADRIFDELMQLDRTVILFDEIDELVRARDVEPDAFGRFLTTSMLPKLAELWKARKVIYFIATNHIRFFDPAVTRAQRFDLIIQVSPPSFDRKITQLFKLVGEMSRNFARVDFTSDDVEQEVRSAAAADKEEAKNPTPLPVEHVLAKFLLLRWDQLYEVAATIAKLQTPKMSGALTRKLMEDALINLADPILNTCGPYKHFVEASKYEQHDFSKTALWEIEGDGSPRGPDRNIDGGGKRWYRWDPMFDDMATIAADCKVKCPGVIQCTRKSARPTRGPKTAGKRKSGAGIR